MPLVRIAEGVSPPRFQTGTHVRFRLGNEFVRGKITEYRGPLAAGRHVYRVEVPFDGNYVMAYELDFIHFPPLQTVPPPAHVTLQPEPVSTVFQA